MLKLSKHKSLYFEFIFNQNQLYQIQFCENQFYFRQNQTHTIRYTEPKIFKSLDDVDIIRIFTTSKTREKKNSFAVKIVPELSNIPGSAYELEHVHKHAKFGKKKPLKGSCFKLLGEEVYRLICCAWSFWLTMWQSISICLVCLWKVGFEPMCLVDWLSQKRRAGVVNETWKSLCKLSRCISHIVSARAQY
jgi:hypothetical protein